MSGQQKGGRTVRGEMPERVDTTADIAPSLLPDGDASQGNTDSANASFDPEDTNSVMSSIAKYREINGRLYHSFGTTEYWGPNDDKAQDQQDLSHHMFTLALDGKLFLAPITPTKVLDLGCGTGIWSMDCAEKYPNATIYGTDLSPIQPNWVPPNCFFEVDDYNVEWVDDKRYDLIHARELLGTVPDWAALYRKAFKSLKPGGWFEQHDPSCFLQSHARELENDHPFTQWGELMIESGKKANARMDNGPHIKEWMEQAGFVNVTEYKMPLLIGGWSKDKRQREIGQWNQLRLDMGVADFCSRRFHTNLGFTPQEIEFFCARMRAAFRDKNLDGWHWAYFVYGQRPEDTPS